MTTKIPFSEYCKSKEYLRLAADDIPQVVVEYELTKYCKFPIVTEEEGGKQHVTFRPKDKIEVVWEYVTKDQPTPRKVVVTTDDEDGEKVQPAWGNTKLSSWIENNTRKAE